MQTNATPLVALDAVALDCDTTGVDPATARLVRIGAARIRGGRLQAETLDIALPAATGEEPQAGFAEAWTKLQPFVGSAIVIGHTVGFDLGAIEREGARAGVEVRRPRTLDIRLLAELARPDLAGFSLDEVAAWLGVAAPGAGAPAHARAIAEVFVALVPKLRDGNIRTLAEAEEACRAFTNALDEERRAAFADAVAAPARADAERTLARIDSYPYRHRVRDVMSTPPLFVPATMTVHAAMKDMTARRISSYFVAPPGAASDAGPFDAARTGIVTERDVMRAVATRGADAFADPVSSIMSHPLAAVPAEAFVYRAIGRMDRMKVRHLGVVDEVGQVVGALSARDLLRLRAGDAVSLGDEIDVAEDVASLGRAWARLADVAEGLVREQVPAREVAAIVSRELGALTRRAAILAERSMAEAGRGEPPCAYAAVVLGSAGRGESLLAMDQDNAIIFAEGEPDGANDRWFAELGSHLADTLHAVGVPYCKGGVMGKTPAWRGSLDTWRGRVRNWIGRSKPEDLLSVDIFFDMRCVHGDGRMARDLWVEAFDLARGQVGFAKLLAEAGGHAQSSITLFGGFKTEEGRLDLKKAGLFALVTAARCLAVRHHVVERSTPARLAGVRALGIGGDRDLDRLAVAHPVFLDAILAQQIEDIRKGLPATNAIVPKNLDGDAQDRLRDALRAVESADDLVKTLLFAAR